MTGRLVVLASGSGSNLQALIDASVDGRLDATIEAVYVNRRSAYARERADNHGIAQDFVPLGPYRDRHPEPRAAREAYDTDLADRIAAHEPDAIVLAGWMHLFTDAFLGRFPNRVVNLHPALPGTFPGAHAIDDAWEAKERAGLAQTGVMIHLVPDEGVDDGPVLLSEVVPIRDDDTRDSLEQRIHEVEHRLLVEAVATLIEAS
ncbi:MAG: phosphoribosylglycinamide formyltransferase [Acidimicrobiales bacterium]|nr:MAG: phosphoribosylglycinamide formyltransferase [Acidimicrobiales bacterium]